jgi:hypothetical protein
MEKYSELFNPQPFKIIAVIYSSVLILILTPLMFSIVRFEKDNHHRTLINRLMSSIVCCAILWNLIVQPLGIFRFAYGPIAFEPICQLNSILRNSLPMNGLLLLDAIMIVKYIFIFHTKNPTAIQDDFWHLFLIVWIVGFNCISQAIYGMSPGKSSPNFYICIGKYPGEDYSSLTVKNNIPFTIVLVLSCIVYLFVVARNVYYKYWVCRQEQEALLNRNKVQMFPLNSKTLVNFTTNGLILALMSACFLLLWKVNKIELSAIGQYPNYIWFYTLHHFAPNTTIAMTVISYFVKSETLRNHCCQELMTFMNGLIRINRVPNKTYSVKTIS